MDFIKIKNFCPVKDPNMKMKRQVANSEKYFQTTDPTNSEYVAYIMHSHYNKNIKNQTIQLENEQKTWRCLNEEDMQSANRHLERCSTSLAIREMQIKITCISLYVYQSG